MSTQHVPTVVPRGTNGTRGTFSLKLCWFWLVMNLWTDGSNTAEQSLCFQGIMWEKDILLQIPEYSKAVPINHLLLVGGKKFFTSFMTHIVRRQCGSSPAIRSIRSEEPSLSAARTPRGSSAGAVPNSRNWGVVAEVCVT